VDRREVAAATDDEEETDVHDKPRLLIDDAPKESTDRIMAQQPRSAIDRRGRPRPSRRHLLMMGWRTAEGRIGPIDSTLFVSPFDSLTFELPPGISWSLKAVPSLIGSTS
jgi:hypothetical protein